MKDAQRITFAALGPLEVRKASRLVPLAGKNGAVLGTLLLDANAFVHRERIVTALWNDPPHSAVANVQTYVSGLRRLLAAAGPDHAVWIETRERGYLLHTDRDRLDLLIFADAADQGHRQVQRNDLIAAERELKHAVGLWRGRPLENVPFGDIITPRLTEIEERFEHAWNLWTEVRLALGDHDRLISDLYAAVAARPLRERIWEQLLLALYRANRRSEALAAYQRVRAILIEEMGIEPGPELQGLHIAILTGDPSLTWLSRLRRVPTEAHVISSVHPSEKDPNGVEAIQRKNRLPSSPDKLGAAENKVGDDGAPSFEWLRPAELPHDIRSFAGRSRELAALSASFDTGGGTQATARPNLWVISGTAGVGKTALAVHWAHLVARSFPDGQLYVNLHGFDPRREPLEPAMALSQLLRSLGIHPTRIPEGLEDREKLYRSLLEGSRIHLLLDDARSPEQVRPLLPGHGAAVVLVTSRFRLTDLVVRDGAVPIRLGPLSPEDTLALLAHAVGRERLAAEEAAAEELGRLCGRLPLALRIAAANIVCGPHGTLAGMVADLGQGDRLAKLAIDSDTDATVGAAFRLSYQSLTPEQRRTFRLLGLIPGPTFTPSTVSALLDCPPAAAAHHLDGLATAHLIEPLEKHRFGLHDLLRQYAADCAEREESGKERRDAQYRLFGCYVRGSDAAGRTIKSSDIRLPSDLVPEASQTTTELTDTGTVLKWLQAELENIIPVVSYCTEHGPLPIAWRIMDALRPFLSVGIYRAEWLELGQRGLDAAQQTGNRQAQAAMHMSLGVAQLALGRLHLSTRHFEQALEAGSECGWLEGTAEATAHLSGVCQRAGHPDRAVELARRAIDLNQEKCHPSGLATAHAILGNSQWVFGNLTVALWHQECAYALYKTTKGEYGQAICLTELAATLHELGDLASAIRHYTEALDICERLGAPARQVQALAGLSRVRNDTGENELALRDAELAVKLARRSRDRRAETNAFDALARACRGLSRQGEAHEHYRKALRMAEHVGVAWDTVHVLIGLTEQQLRLKDRATALATGHRAHAMAQEHGFRLLESKAAETLGTVEADCGAGDRAFQWYRKALDIYRDIGHYAAAIRLRRSVASDVS